MHNIFCSAVEGSRAPAQMIWLPGAYHSAQDFVNEGFARAAAQRHIRVDLQFVDLEMQHLDDRDAFARLRAELGWPARDSVRAVWQSALVPVGSGARHYASS